MLELTSNDESQALNTLLNRVDPGGIGSYWIGVEDFDVIFAFMYASSGKKLSFTNWDTFQPDNNHGTGQYCVRIEGPSRLWDDDNCFFKYYAICQTMN